MDGPNLKSEQKMKKLFLFGPVILLILLFFSPVENIAGDRVLVDSKLEALSQGDYSAKKISYDPTNDVIVITYEYSLMDSVVAAISKDKGHTWSYYYRYLSTSSANNPSVLAGFNKGLNKNTDYIVLNGYYYEGIKNPMLVTFDQGGYDADNWLPETYVSADSNCWLPSPDIDEDGNLYVASYEPYNPAQSGDHTSGINFIKVNNADLSNAGVDKVLLASQKNIGTDSLGNPDYENTAPILDYGSDGTVYVMSTVRETQSTSDLLFPAFWRSTDYGATWSGMQYVPLSGLPLNPDGEVELQGGYDLGVDKNNTPHFAVQVRRDTTVSTQSVYIYDSFDDGDLGANPNGTGSGFTTYLQGTAKAEEYDGDLILTGNANWDIASAYSKETVAFFTDKGAKFTFNITDCNKPDPTGAYRAYLGLSSTNECSFPPEAGDRIAGSGGCGLWLLGDGDAPFRWVFYYEQSGRKEIANGTLATYKGGAPLTITMTLNNTGWSFAASGGEGDASGTWPAGFWDGKGEAYVGVAAQGGITNLELLLGSLKAEPVTDGATQNVFLDDSFDNGDLATNPNGTGSGFSSYLQGTAKAEEYDGDLILTGNANWDIASAYSKETVDFFTDGGAQLTFDITDCNKPNPTGSYRVYLGLSSTNECSFPPEAGDRIKGSGSCGLWLMGDGDAPFRWTFYHEFSGRVNIAEGTLATYKGGAPITIAITVNKNGWSFTASGGEGSGSGSWPAGFWDGKGEAYVGVAAQGGIPNMELLVANIKAEPGVSSAIVNDSFDDGDLGANPNGTGSGFTTYLQGTAKAEEYDGDLILTGNANWDIASAYSKETVAFFTDGGAKLTFDITDCNKPDPTGAYRVYLGLSSTNECSFPPEAGDRIEGSGSCGLWLMGDGDAPFRWTFYHEFSGRVNIAEGTLATYKGGAPITIAITVNKNGWSFTASGGEGSGSGTWPAGFWDGKGEAYVGVAAQGGITNLELLAGSIIVESITASAVVDDSFDNGDLATNPNGIGSGLTSYLQGTAKAEEYDGDLILTGNANWDIASAYTKETIDFFTDDGAQLTFDITDCNKPDPTGSYRVYLGLSSTNECSFPPEAGDRIQGSGSCGLWLMGDGDAPFRWVFYYEQSGRKEIANGTLATYKGGAPLTITMTVNNSGWSFTASDNEGSSSGTWPDGFWDGEGEAYIGVAAQGGIANLELLLGRIKAEVLKAGAGGGESTVERAVRDIYDLHLVDDNWTVSKIATHHSTDYFQYKDPHGNVQIGTDSEGNLFAMWAGYAKGIGSAVQTDVFLSYSTDGGQTWSNKTNVTNTSDIDEAVVNLADQVGDQLHFSYQTIESYEYLHNRFWLGDLYYMNYENPAKNVLVSKDDNVVRKFELAQNYPNPFNPTTVISFEIPKSEQVKINIYNLKGELVKTLLDAKKESGSYEVYWDGTDALGKVVASGLYFYRLESSSFIKTKKMSLLK
jgi:hypothetical protein